VSGPPIISSKLTTGQRSKCGTSKTLTNLGERTERKTQFLAGREKG